MLHTIRARPRLVLALVVTTQLMIVLDNTVVILALPSIQADFGASAGGLAWISNGYILAFGGLLLLGGRLGDVLGRRRVLLLGITLFTVASLIGGAAPTEAVLIAARVVQGAGAAMVAPNGLALLLVTFAEGPSRNKMLGVFFAMSAAGAAVGLLAGGVLTSALSWSWVLWINVPLGLAILAAGPRVLTETPLVARRFDLLGTATSTIGVTALVFGLIRAGQSGWSDVVGLLAFLAAAVLLPVFVVVERRVEQPLLALRLFERRATASAYAAMLLVPAVMVSMAFYTAQYMQNVLSYTAIEAGLAFLPMSMIIFLASRTVPGLVARFGARRFPIAGAVLLLAALAWLLQLSVSRGYLLGLAPALVLIGLGGGLLYMPLSALLLGGVCAEDAGAASGAMQAVQQIGGALGIAVLVSVFSATAGGSSDAVTPSTFTDAVTDAYQAGLGLAALALVSVLLATRPKSLSIGAP
jgi:EmrB/QacA subfamily drug resistance transporter